MQQVVRAVYESGRFRLLDPVELAEGQQVTLTISQSERDALRAALSDMPVKWPDPSDDSDAGLEEMAEVIDSAFRGSPPLSEVIIQDRGER
jgi:predicted DNA-binding antitoxin AbrB/MazE fold protein